MIFKLGLVDQLYIHSIDYFDSKPLTGLLSYQKIQKAFSKGVSVC